jgi:hypothetical protein
MGNKHCLACGQSFQPRPQVPQQSYCPAPDCQRTRKRSWLNAKLETDPDYQDNQTRARQAWLERNPTYWREYREAHPEYTDRNRVLQKARNAKTSKTTPPIAKMDASNVAFPLKSGRYQLSVATESNIAKMDVWTVDIRVHAHHKAPRATIAKR